MSNLKDVKPDWADLLVANLLCDLNVQVTGRVGQLDTLSDGIAKLVRDQREQLRKAIADCLKGNAFPETQWGKGYCAGILAALTAFDGVSR